MNYIDEVFDRCDITNLRNYILYGDEVPINQTDDFYERSQKAYQALHDWLENLFPDPKDYDEQSCKLRTITTELENISMQTGFEVGLKLAANINNKQNT